MVQDLDAAVPIISFDLNELCRQGDVTARTVRYYIQQGLLPSPGLGAGARYAGGHLARLRLIRKMQREHLPLAEIRRRLEGLDDEAVVALLESGSAEGSSSLTSAVDYVRAVLQSPRAGVLQAPTSPPSRPSSAPAAPAGAVPLRTGSRPGTSPGTGPLPERARWDRIALTPDVEIHVRRPLSREDNRRLEKLLEQARAILGDEGV